MLPQRHIDGLSGIGQSYRNLTASPAGCASFTCQVHGSLYVLSGNKTFTSLSSSLSPPSFSFRMLLSSRRTSVSSGVSWDCASILLASGVLTLIDAEYSTSALSDGFMSPSTCIRTGNATRLRPASEQYDLHLFSQLKHSFLHSCKSDFLSVSNFPCHSSPRTYFSDFFSTHSFNTSLTRYDGMRIENNRAYASMKETLAKDI